MRCHDLKQQRSTQREPKHPVAEKLCVERGPGLVAGVEDVEELEQHEGRERHGQGAVTRPCLQPVMQHRQRAHHHRRAARKDTCNALQRQHRLSARTRRRVHDLRAWAVECKRHGGRPVHDDRDPQNLQRRKRLGHPQ